MGRRRFGFTADTVATKAAGGGWARRVTGTVWAAQDGPRVWDVARPDGRLWPGGLVVSDDAGRVVFLGPRDGTDELWVDFGAGRILVHADTHARLLGLYDRDQVQAGRVDAVDAEITAVTASKGAPGGVASLDAGGLLPAAQMPATKPPLLGNISDVRVDAPRRGQVLLRDGMRWRPGTPDPVIATVDDWPQPTLFYGGGYRYLPNTLETARWALAGGYGLQLAVAATVDGVALADAPRIELEFEIPQVYSPTRRTADPSSTFGAHAGPWTTCTLGQILDLVGGRLPIIFSIIGFYQPPFEDTVADTSRAVEATIREVTRRGLQRSVIIQVGFTNFTGNLSNLAPWHLHTMIADAGIDAGYGFATPLTLRNWTPQQLHSYGIRWITTSGLSGFDNHEFDPENVLTAADIARWNAAGIKMIHQNVALHAQRDQLAVDGWSAAMTDDPTYLGPAAGYRMTVDPFAGQEPPVGMGAEGWDHSFAAPDWWLPDVGFFGGPGSTTLLGWACPLASPAAFTLTFTAMWPFADTFASDGLRIGICAPTDRIQFIDDGDLGFNGILSAYEAVIGGDGTIAWFRVPDAPGPKIVGPTGADTPLADGVSYTYTITVDGDSVSISRTGGITVEWVDATVRGGYLYVGANGFDLQLRNITIS